MWTSLQAKLKVDHPTLLWTCVMSIQLVAIDPCMLTCCDILHFHLHFFRNMVDNLEVFTNV